MNAQDALVRLIEHRELFHDEMLSIMRQIMAGELSPVMIAALTVGLRVKKETVGEIAAAAQVMREMATKVPVAAPDQVVDIVGTGGDGAHTFNISTASMFVAAACGAKVAKHGGRSVSSKSGSADALEALGININMSPEKIAAAIEEVGIGFMFAPNHHGAMKHAAPVRRELGVRTLFNILGPLTNPAGATRQLLGVFHADLVGILIHVLKRLGAVRAMTVFGREGLDELSISGPTLVGELKNDVVTEYEVTPEQFDLPVHSIQSLKVANVEESRERLLQALEGKFAAGRDIVALNTGAALYIAGKANSITEGVHQALEAIHSGAARAKLNELVVFSQKG